MYCKHNLLYLAYLSILTRFMSVFFINEQYGLATCLFCFQKRCIFMTNYTHYFYSDLNDAYFTLTNRHTQ